MLSCFREWVYVGECINPLVIMNKEQVDILAIGVHPDDIELGCGGTLLKHRDLGYSVGLLDLTKGELGTRGSAELRLKEAEAARQVFGAAFRWNAELADGFFENNESSNRSLIKFIRKARPAIVLANAPHDRHPDHGRASKLTREACFYAGLKKIEVFDEDLRPLAPWRPKVLYHYIQDFNLEPDFVVDIDGYFEKKIESVLCFGSQFFDPKGDNKDNQTPISSKSFLDFLKARAVVHGRHIACEYGEGFIKDRYLGVNDLFDLK